MIPFFQHVDKDVVWKHRNGKVRVVMLFDFSNLWPYRLEKRAGRWPWNKWEPTKKHFSTLNSALNYIEAEMPPEEYAVSRNAKGK